MSHTPHPLATLEQIVATPSSRDGIPSDLEDDLRVVGCMLIQEAGIMLDLPQNTMATAQVLLHRFYYVSSLASFGVNDISISSLFLASKLCETTVRLRDLINVYLVLLARIQHILSLSSDYPLQSGILSHEEDAQDPIWRDFNFNIPRPHDEVFWDWKDVVTASEMQILKRLGFNMQVDLPYSHMINYLRILDLVFEDQVGQMCWSVLNDMLLTPLYAIHPPHTLACISILLTTRLLHIPLPPKWYLLFDVSFDEIWTACGFVMKLWDQWGLDRPTDVLGQKPGTAEERIGAKDARWRRAWILAQSRKAVRRWVEERKAEQ
ncbi:hypothetical protein L204_105448 [Cryptococcus depauperatus]|nr:cyclin-dependent protein kinase regulator [Cryptococcus depauperatus CBS 7855]